MRWQGLCIWGAGALIAVLLFHDRLEKNTQVEMIIDGCVLLAVGIWLAPTKE